MLSASSHRSSRSILVLYFYFCLRVTRALFFWGFVDSVLLGGGVVFSGVCFPSLFTRRNSHKPEDLTYPVLSPFLSTSPFLCLYNPHSLGTFSLSFLQFALSPGRCTGNCGFYLAVCVFVETTVNQTASFYTPLRFRSFSIANLANG